MRKKVTGYSMLRAFSTICRTDWMIRFIEHRIADRRIVRLIRGWLRA